MGFGASASRQRTDQNVSQNTSTNNTGQRRAVFDSPEAQSVLASLTGQATGSPNYNEEAAGIYRGMAGGGGGGINPFVENIISASNKEGDRALQSGLAGVRAGAYRGGTGASMYGQGNMVANAANTRAKDNASLRYGAYNDNASRALSAAGAGAGGLANLGQGNQSLAAQILALLRGENTNETGTGVMTGTQSGTSSGTKGGFNWGSFSG